MSFLLNLTIAINTSITLCANKITTDCIILLVGIGFSKKLLHEAMWVVNRKGLILSKTETSKDPIMVKRMIIAIVDTMGPMELSAKADKQMESVEIVSRERNATKKLRP